MKKYKSRGLRRNSQDHFPSSFVTGLEIIIKVYRLTYFLLFLIVGTLGLTSARYKQKAGGNTKESDYTKQLQARKLRFPTAEYNEADSTDPKRNESLKEKKVRKNNFKLVARNPPAWQTERIAINEGGIDFPALPVAQSEYVVLGKVTEAEAHLSENKKNVYSEFKVVIEKVLKTASSSIIPGTEITVDRIGGVVKYPNGRSVLYRIADTNMPVIGERYLLFLTSKNQQDISILTAYELGVTVTPLDESPQFEKYQGVAESLLLQNVQDALTKSSPY